MSTCTFFEEGFHPTIGWQKTRLVWAKCPNFTLKSTKWNARPPSVNKNATRPANTPSAPSTLRRLSA